MKKLNYEAVKKYIESNSESKLLSTEYIEAKSKLKLKCKCGKEFERTYDYIKHKGSMYCNKCSCVNIKISKSNKEILHKARLKPIEDVIDLVDNQMKCKFIKRYTKEGTRSTVIVFECSKHGIQEAYWTNLVKRKGCPLCNEYNKQNSKGIISIGEWLNNNDLKFTKEMKFINCKDKRALPFDYYLVDKNVCIEFDGRQHFENAYFGNINKLNSDKNLIYTKKHDEIKNKYCLDNNIKLIRIPYFNENNIEIILESALL